MKRTNNLFLWRYDFSIKIVLLFFCNFISFFSLNSQNVVIKGKVTDTFKNPLAYSNILAEPIGESQLEYAFTDDNGYYKLILKKNEKYTFRLSYIGYQSKIFNLNVANDTLIDFQLIESLETLSEIKIDASVALSFKKRHNHL